MRRRGRFLDRMTLLTGGPRDTSIGVTSTEASPWAPWVPQLAEGNLPSSAPADGNTNTLSTCSAAFSADFCCLRSLCCEPEGSGLGTVGAAGKMTVWGSPGGTAPACTTWTGGETRRCSPP